MMIRHTTLAVVLSCLIVLAGCAGGAGSGPESGSTDTLDEASAGTVAFYISDERNAIGDFDHLNVTISQVGFVRADTNEAEDNETDDSPGADDGNHTTEGTETNTTSTVESGTESVPETTANESDLPAQSDHITRAVENVTVDLTAYQGANATRLTQFAVPNGTYEQAFISVERVSGTLTSGEMVDVKLPSNTLRLNHEFTVGTGEQIDFVFDITVFAAGSSGKYILKPVASESGTDVPITTDSNERGAPVHAGSSRGADATNTDEDALSIDVQGPVEPGASVQLTVKQADDGLANAAVFVAGDRVGRTDAAGTMAINVPVGVEAFEVRAQSRDQRVLTTLMVEINRTTASG